MKQKLQAVIDHSELLMLIFAAIGIVFANTSLSGIYNSILHFEVPLLGMSFETFVVEFLLSFFFFSIGLELKKEITIGSLRSVKTATIPVIASFFGAVCPALIFITLLYFTHQNPDLSRCWGIVISTDVAFSLAILKITTKKIASQQTKRALRTFLLTIAIVDDFIGIVVIAIFYSNHVSLFHLLEMLVIYIIAWIIIHIEPRATFILAAVGIILWGLCYKAGLTPELVGALIAFAVPTYTYKDSDTHTKKHKILLTNIDTPERYINNFVSLVALPLFAFCSIQVNFQETFSQSFSDSSAISSSLTFLVIVLLSPIIGKPLGIVGSSLLASKLTNLNLGSTIKARHLLAIGSVASIGFTVSFLVADIGFVDDLPHLSLAKIAIFSTAIIATLITFAGLRIYRKVSQKEKRIAEK